jgi:hypothetical protein
MNIVLVPIAFFAAVAAAIPGSIWFATKRRTAALGLIQEAVAKGQTLDAALIERLMPARRFAVGKWFGILCLLLGMPVLGVGTGLLLAGSFLTSGETAAGMLTGGMVELSLGVGFTTLGFVSLRKLTGDAAPRWDFATLLALVCLFCGVASLAMFVSLSVSSLFYPDAEARAGYLMGALVNAGSGAGFFVLGVFILRVFGDPSDPDRGG